MAGFCYARLFSLHGALSFGMMQTHARDPRANRDDCGFTPLRLRFALHPHDRALVHRAPHRILRVRNLVLAVDQPVRNDRAPGILSDARSQRSAEFQDYRNDLRRRHARRQFLLLLQNGAGPFLRLRSRRAALFFTYGFRTADVCALAPRRTVANDGLYVVWPALCALAF